MSPRALFQPPHRSRPDSRSGSASAYLSNAISCSNFDSAGITPWVQDPANQRALFSINKIDDEGLGPNFDQRLVDGEGLPSHLTPAFRVNVPTRKRRVDRVDDLIRYGVQSAQFTPLVMGIEICERGVMSLDGHHRRSSSGVPSAAAGFRLLLHPRCMSCRPDQGTRVRSSLPPNP